MSETRILEHVVTAGEAGRRLDRVLAAAHPQLSRSAIQASIADGRLTADGRTVRQAARRVKAAAKLALALPPPRPARPQPQAMALEILHEDRHLLVVNKPPGLVVHPAAGNPDGTLVNALIAHCGAGLSGIGGERRPGIVHRLDKDTGGLMAVAKDDRTHIRLAAAIAARRVERGYRALAWGLPQPGAGSIEGAIGRSRRQRRKMAVLDRGGKPALTHYRVERSWAGAVSLLRCQLASGRTHQIRVHLAHIGHAVLGDPLYGRSGGRHLAEPARQALAAMGRQALHADRLAFHHPATKRWLQFESPLPADMAALASALDTAYLQEAALRAGPPAAGGPQRAASRGREWG